MKVIIEMLVPTWYARKQWKIFNGDSEPRDWECTVCWGRFPKEGSHLYCVFDGGLRWNAQGIPHSILDEHGVVPKKDLSRIIPIDRLFLAKGDMKGGCNGMYPADDSQEGIMWEEIVIDATKFFAERNAVIKIQKWWRSKKT